MNLADKTKKEIGALGEVVACEYLKRHGFRIVDRNVARKTGELDIVAKREGVLHIVEVKALACAGFPSSIATADTDEYDPSVNLHEYKIRKVARTAEWYVANIDWEGDWQVDGCLVWLRERDGMARVRYLPQIV